MSCNSFLTSIRACGTLRGGMWMGRESPVLISKGWCALIHHWREKIHHCTPAAHNAIFLSQRKRQDCQPCKPYPIACPCPWGMLLRVTWGQTRHFPCTYHLTVPFLLFALPSLPLLGLSRHTGTAWLVGHTTERATITPYPL